MASLKMISPWVKYYREVDAMFKNDPEVHVVYDEDEMELKIYVDDQAKGEAIERLLPHEKAFSTGTVAVNIVLKISVVPCNKSGRRTFNCSDDDPKYYSKLFRAAFCGNQAFCDVIPIDGVFGFYAAYVIFAKEVVQYYSDNIGDYFGVISTLYQDIAMDIFKELPGVFYCTDNGSYRGPRTPAYLGSGPAVF